MKDPSPIEGWPFAFDLILNGGVPGPLRHATVLRETESTQDAARILECPIGEVVVAGRQKRGRGRLGRTWDDTQDDGVAMTIVLPRDRPERLSLAAGISACYAIEMACKDRDLAVSIKWPNDVLVAGRKIAGVLVEQFDDRALVGIGVNVHQVSWPDHLRDTAVSLAQLGIAIGRLPIMLDIVCYLQVMMRIGDSGLEKAFAQRDGLRGAVATFRCDNREICGRVLRVDPMRGLAVQTDSEGEVWLPAATTTVLDWTP